MGDFNGDGRQDFATANQNSGTVSIRLGDGLGGFSGTTDVAVGAQPYSVAVGDFNGDGRQDFATANAGGNTVSIRLGGFSGTTNVAVGSVPRSVAVGDFNGDGNQDFATANQNSNTVSVRLGDGLGGFSGTTNVAVGSFPFSVAVGDFNGDGRQDFAASNYNSNTVSIRLGDGAGGFSGTTNVAVGSFPYSVAVGDFNGDGRQDFAAANTSGNTVSIRLGGIAEINVQGGSPLTDIPDGDIAPTAAKGTDFGNVIVSGNSAKTFTVQNTGTTPLNISSIASGNALFVVSGLTLPAIITAGGSATFTVTFNPTATGTQNATITLNNDDCDEAVYDFAVTGTGVVPPTLGTYQTTSLMAGQNAVITPSVAPNNATSIVAYTNTNFTGVLAVNPTTGVLTVTKALQAGVYAVTVKAFNGAVSTTTAFSLTVTNPTCSQGTFNGTTNVAVGSKPFSVAVGDFNGDGRQDFAAANYIDNTVSIRLGDGLGGFSGTTDVGVGANPFSVAVGDFNGDGRQDFAAANLSSNTVSIRLGDGLGGFSGTTDVGVGANPFSVAVGDFNGDGRQDFAAANLSSNTVSIRLGDGLGGFSGTTDVAVGSAPRSVAVGDFNGDGKSDFAAANYSSNTVSIRLGDGLGSFSGTTNVAVGTYPFSVAVGDFNGDGRQDFAAANSGGSSVCIRLGDGLGGFSGTTDVAVGTNPFSVAVGDFNGDGRQDFAAANFFSNTVSLRLGDGAGGFSGTTDVAVGAQPRSVAVGDFNGDGRQDFAAANENSTMVSIRLGVIADINVQGGSPLTNIPDGDTAPTAAKGTDFGNVNVSSNEAKTFTIQNTGTTPLTISSITSNNGLFVVSGLTLPATITAGGSATFTVTFSPTATGPQNATITLNNDDCDEAVYDFAVTGNGVLPTLGTYPATSMIAGQNAVITPSVAPTNATSIVAYTTPDFTGVLVVNPTTGVLSVTKALQAGVYAVTVKAFNGAVSTTTAFTLTVTNPTCSQGTFNGTTDVAVESGPWGVAVGDFNGDGRQDIISANEFSNTVSIRLGDGMGGFSGTTDVVVGTQPRSVALGDFNGDGRQDFAVVYNNSNTVSIRLGDGLGGFSGTTDIAVGTQPRSVAVGDFNGDGFQDLATANFGSASVSIRLGDGAGGFSGTTDVGVGLAPRSIAVGDFNGDGRQDFAAANYSSNTVSIRLGDGLGGFSGTTNVAVGSLPYSVAVGDFNGDGRQDFATANQNSGTVSIRLGDGLGGFSGTTDAAVGSLPSSVAVGDFNGDGWQDFATANYSGNTVSIRLGDGLGGFSGTTNVAVGSRPNSVAVGDFNGDGRQDFAAANAGSGTVSIRLGGVAEINLRGGSPLTDIPDDDNAPTAAKGTDFGNVNVTGNSAKTFTIQNTGSTPLNISSIVSNNGLFVVSGLTLPETITAGGSATFTVTFNPTATGTQNATITLNNDDCDEAIYDFAITGNGACPVLTAAAPAAQVTNSTCGAGCIISGGSIAAPSGTCPAASTLHYSTDNGANWSTTLPIYAQSGPAQTIKTRCLCDADPTQFSQESSVTTAPGTVPALNIPTNETAIVAYPALATQPAPPVVNDCSGSPITPSNPVITDSPNPLTCEGTRTYTYTYTCGSNTATWSFVYTIIDNMPPAIICPANLTVCESTMVTYTPPVGTDNCIGSVTTQIAGLSSGSVFPVGLTTNEFKVTATNGQSSTCSFTVTVNPLPKATISGTVTVCQNAPAPAITFTGSGSTAPYTFTYKINNGSNQTITATNGNSVSVPQSTANAGVFEYNLLSVKDGSLAQCSQNQSGSVIVTVLGKPIIALSVNGQTFNEGNNSTLCDTDANPVNGLQFTVLSSCVLGNPVWRTQAGNGAWSSWANQAPVAQSSDNQNYRYQAACDGNCPSTYTNPISITINYRASTPQNVSLLADGTTVAAGESKTICNLEGNSLTFNATCAAGEILLYSVDGGEYSTNLPIQIVDNNFHNYRVRCRKTDNTPACVETESAAMSLKITTAGPAPTVSISPTNGCGTPTAFSGSSNCGTLTTIWYNATTNQALPTLPTSTPNATTSFYARCQNEAGCLSENSNTVTFSITPVNDPPVVTASAEIVCTGTTVTISANCSVGSTAFWNTGVTTNSFQVAFSNVTQQTYWAKCIFPNGCQSPESVHKTIFWKAFELTFINIGQSQSAIKPANDRNLWTAQFITKDAGPVLENSTEANPTIYYSENVNKTAPRFWTIQAETCNLGTDGSVTYDILAAPEVGVVRSYNTHENNAPYLMYANREGFTELYAQNHPAYGFYQDNGSGVNVYDTGLPKGLYKLGIRYWDQKGQGSIYPSTRQPAGNVLAYQEYWFRIQSQNGVGTGSARVAAATENGQRTTDNGAFAQVMPNPVANIMHLKINEVKGKKVNVSMVDASGRTLVQRAFVPQTNQHQEEFEVSELANGIYFLRVNTAEKQATLKVVKME